MIKVLFSGHFRYVNYRKLKPWNPAYSTGIPQYLHFRFLKFPLIRKPSLHRPRFVGHLLYFQDLWLGSLADGVGIGDLMKTIHKNPKGIHSWAGGFKESQSFCFFHLFHCLETTISDVRWRSWHILTKNFGDGCRLVPRAESEYGKTRTALFGEPHGFVRSKNKVPSAWASLGWVKLLG